MSKELFSAGRDGKIRMFKSEYNSINNGVGDNKNVNQIYLKPMA